MRSDSSSTNHSGRRQTTVAALRRRGVVEEYDRQGLKTVNGIATVRGNYPSKGVGERDALVQRLVRGKAVPADLRLERDLAYAVAFGFGPQAPSQDSGRATAEARGSVQRGGFARRGAAALLAIISSTAVPDAGGGAMDASAAAGGDASGAS
jgi:hypothetical protein